MDSTVILSQMITEKQSEQLHLFTVVKEEPTEEVPEISTFTFETVTKEEVLLDDQLEPVDGQPEPESEPPSDISKKQPFQCSQCNRSYERVFNLNRCVERHNALRLGLYKCKFCGRPSSTKKVHLRHEATHKKGSNQSHAVDDSSYSESGLFKCNECDRTYMKRYLANKCKNKHVARRLGLYQCKFCSVRAATPSDLRRHELRHKSNAKPLQFVETAIPAPEPAVKMEPSEGSEGSSFCFESVMKEEVILDDQLEHADQRESLGGTETSKERPFKCSECDRTFTKASYLNRCVKRHHVLRLGLYKCEVCGKCSNNKQIHLRHVKTHKNKPIGSASLIESSTAIVQDENGLFKCVECNRTHKQRNWALGCAKRHLAKRLGLFKCKLCSLRAGTASELRKHEQIHQRNKELLQAVEAASPTSEQDNPATVEGVKKDLPEESESKKAIPVGEKMIDSNGEQFDASSLQIEKDENGFFKCPECELSFIERFKAAKCMKKHWARRTGLYECKICHLRPGTLYELRKHELRHKPKPIPEPKQDKPPSVECVNKEPSEELESSSSNTETKKDQPEYVSVESSHELDKPPTGQGVKKDLPEESESKRVVPVGEKMFDSNGEQFDTSSLQIEKDENGFFKCPECELSFIERFKAAKCMKKHWARRTGLYECKICHLRPGTLHELRKHELRHKPKPIPEPKQDKPPSVECVNKEPSEELESSSSNTETKKDQPEYVSVESSHELDKPPTGQGVKKDLPEESESNKAVPVGEKMLDSNGEQFDASSLQIEKDENDLFRCPECERSFNQRFKAAKCMKRHWARRTGLYECKICHLRPGTLDDLRKHEHNRHKPKPIPEPNTETKKDQPEYVIVESPQDRPFKCSECSRTFDRVADLQRCKRKHHLVKLERYKCKFCGKCFVSKFDLSRHEGTHAKVMQLKSSVTSDKTDKDSKESNVQSKDDENLFKCSECHRRFKVRYMATKCEKKHLARRLGLYECKICKRRTANMNELRRHELKHKRRVEPKAKPKWFACKICEKQFVKEESIKKHMQTHQKGALPLTCHRCDVKFATRGELHSHIHRHDWDATKHEYFAKLVKEADGTYLCTICNKKFVNQRTAIAHVFRHMNLIEGLFECKTCGLRCGDAYEHKIHCQIHDKPKETPDVSDSNPLPEETDGNPPKESDGTQKSSELDCKICRKYLRNKQSLARHEIIHWKNFRRKQILEEAAKKGNKEVSQTNENGSSFSYETVMKEELIIEDDAFGESGTEEWQEEDSRDLLEESQPVKHETSSQQAEESCESLEEQREPMKCEEPTEENVSQLPKKNLPEPQLPKDAYQLKCNVCQKIFSKRDNLKRHHVVHVKSKIPLECERCKVKFDDRYSLRKHYETHKGESRSKFSFLLQKSKEGRKCLLCEKIIEGRDNAFAHAQRHMNIIDGVFKCKVCGLRCGGKSGYQLHIKTHKNTHDQSALPREIEGVHTDYDSSSKVACEKSDLPLHCKTCNVFFNNKTNWNVHLWTSKLRIIRSKDTSTAQESSDKNFEKQVDSTVQTHRPKGRKGRLSKLLLRDDGFYNCSKYSRLPTFIGSSRLFFCSRGLDYLRVKQNSQSL